MASCRKRYSPPQVFCSCSVRIIAFMIVWLLIGRQPRQRDDKCFYLIREVSGAFLNVPTLVCLIQSYIPIQFVYHFLYFSTFVLIFLYLFHFLYFSSFVLILILILKKCSQYSHSGMFTFVLIFQQYWSSSYSQTTFLLEKIKVDDGIFSGLNVKRRFSDYRF